VIFPEKKKSGSETISLEYISTKEPRRLQTWRSGNKSYGGPWPGFTVVTRQLINEASLKSSVATVVSTLRGGAGGGAELISGKKTEKIAERKDPSSLTKKKSGGGREGFSQKKWGGKSGGREAGKGRQTGNTGRGWRPWGLRADKAARQRICEGNVPPTPTVR